MTPRGLFTVVALLTAAHGCKGGDHHGDPPIDACHGTLAFDATGLFAVPQVGGFVRSASIEAIVAKADVQPLTGNKNDFTSFLVLDVNADGRADILYNRASQGTSVVVQTSSGGFESQGLLATHPTCMFAADLDGDGFPDVFCTGPTAIAWGGPTGVDFSAPTPLPVPPDEEMAAAAWDLDEDGLLDIVLAPFGGQKVVLRNKGNRQFENVAAAWGLDVPGNTWQVSFLDLDGDGRPDVYVSNDGQAKLNYAFRATGPGLHGEPGFATFEPLGSGCDQAGLFSQGQENPMGVALGDLTGRGALQVVLAVADPDPLLAMTSPGHWANVATDARFPAAQTTTGRPLVHWSPVFWDVDHDGLLDLLVPTGDDAGFGAQPGRGTSFPLYYRGLGGGAFAEIHQTAGLDDRGHFMNLYLADLDGDGELDLFLGGFGQAVHVYENRVGATGGHVVLTLKGSTSNPEGLGGIVETVSGGVHRVYQMGDHFGPRVTGAPLLDLGFGAHQVLDELHVRWPSGYEQVLRDVKRGKLTVVEPPIVTVDPPARHLPADGATEARIVVRPVDAEGKLLANAHVSIEAPFDTVTWLAAEEPSANGATERRMRSPAQAGSTVIEVKVDGKAVRVRPRLWFDAPVSAP